MVDICKWTKILALESSLFLAKNDGKKWFVSFYFEIQGAPSELLLPSAKKICPGGLNWPGRLAGISN